MTTLVMNSRSNVVSGAESKSEHRSALLNLTGIDAADEQDEVSMENFFVACLAE